MMAEVNPKYLKGFNHGYFLAQHRPSLAKKILSQQDQRPYFDGFDNGVTTFQNQQKSQSRTEELKILKERNEGEKDLER